jgi:hypothetical protein
MEEKLRSQLKINKVREMKNPTILMNELITMKKRVMYIGTMTPKPTLICEKLGYTGRLQPTESEGLTLLGQSDHISFAFDVKTAEIKVILDANNLEGAITELEIWMKSHKIPFYVEEDSTFFIDAKDLPLSDIQILEEYGFKKVDENNTIFEYLPWKFS